MRIAFLAVILGLMSGLARGAEPAAVPNDAGEFAASYQIPTVENITRSLEAIRHRLERGVSLRIVDSETGRAINDLSKPIATAILDDGPEHKFVLGNYPMGVIDSGMLAAAAATKDKAFAGFAGRHFQFFADRLPALAKWPADMDRRNPLVNLLYPHSLDSCGALGTAMVQARLAGVGPDMETVIERWGDYVHTRQYRLADGTLARHRPFGESLWLDDAYMGVPLLAEMGKMTGDVAYYDDATKQIKLFYSHLFVAPANLFTHGCHIGIVGDQPKYFWGRANGWFIMALVNLLGNLPANYPERSELIHILQMHAVGIAGCQSGSGLWRQMLDRPDSYLETSCSAMFTYALAKGVNEGWLDAGAYAPVALAGWNGLATRISGDGRIVGTCVGTSYAADYAYYYHRPATDDVHGYGPVLLAGAEMIRMLENHDVRIYGGGVQPIMVRGGENPVRDKQRNSNDR